jgi:hypothetical protein
MSFDPSSAALEFDTDFESIFEGAVGDMNHGPISYVDPQVGSVDHQGEEEDDDEDEDEAADQVDQQPDQDETTFHKTEDGSIWFRPPLPKFPCDIGVRDFGDARGVKVYFATPATGMQHVFVTAETFAEQFDDDSGEIVGYEIVNPTELYAKIAEKHRRETLQLQTQATGMPPKHTAMKTVVAPKVGSLAGFRIPRKRIAPGDNPQPSTSKNASGTIVTAESEFPTTTPGTATGNNVIGHELIKRARTMRFEGRMDKGKRR